MAEFEPWDSGCLGCIQEAMIKETSFELIKREAIEYGNKNKIDLVIYMEAHIWRYLKAEVAHSLGIIGRETIYYDRCLNP